MHFSWLDPTPRANQNTARLAAAKREIATFAALLYRLGYSVEAATARIAQRVAWEFDQPATGSHRRGNDLSDAAITELVAATYARRPT